MATATFHVKLEGKGELHEPTIKLENIKVNLNGSSDGTTWENSSVVIDISDDLEIHMSCKAISGTEWEFFVKGKGTDTKIYEAEGKTGEPLDSQKGESIPNFSERKVSIQI